jgi:twitching motility two-component system response regulator PilG
MSEIEAVDLVKQGIALARAGDKPQARPLLRQAVEQDPANESAWMWLASVAESPQEALAALERVLALNPDHEQARAAAHAARLKVGVAAAKAHKNARARPLLSAVTAAEPENELAWMWLANIAESPAEAATCLERVLAINPENDLARSTYERCQSAAHAASPAPRVPAGSGDPAPTGGEAHAERNGRDGRPATYRTILMVDDDPDVREALARVLVDGGYQIIAAADGYEAINVLRDQGAPNLILLAAALPGGLDGFQLCKLLRENAATSQVPMVLLSETNSLISKMRGRMAGASAELVKPFDGSDLLRVVKELCPLRVN